MNAAKRFPERGSILDKIPKRKSFPSNQKLDEIRNISKIFKRYHLQRIVRKRFQILELKKDTLHKVNKQLKFKDFKKLKRQKHLPTEPAETNHLL